MGKGKNNNSDSNENKGDNCELEIETQLSISVEKPGCPEAELNFDISKEVFLIALILSLLQQGLGENEES